MASASWPNNTEVQLKNRSSGLLLTSENGNISTKEFNSNLEQKFHKREISEGTYYILDQKENYVTNFDCNVYAQSAKDSDDKSQQWRLEEVNGYFHIISEVNGLVITSNDNSNSCQMTEKDEESFEQMFSVIPVE